MKKIAILAIIIGITACNKNNTAENTTNKETNKISEKAIDATLKKMYFADSHNQFPLNDTLIFSKEIVELNKKCDSLSNAEAQKVSQSDTPTDKPFTREGSRITSVYEGVTDFKIIKIASTAKNAEVEVTLSNKNYPNLKPWNEKIILINENGLKIDNIYFNKEQKDSNEVNLKEGLKKFIQPEGQVAYSRKIKK